MNNEQFRRLVLDNPKPTSSSSAKATATPTPARKDGGATPGPGAVLGSRMRSSIPMTPRSVKGVDFARQLAEHRREQQQPPTKKFKSYDPKGSKLASGYQDRAQLRRELEEKEQEKEDDVQDKEKRVKALEEMVKLGQIDQATFEKLRAEIGVGGDVRTAPLVKGLDWELLRRVKAGEDVTKPVEKPLVPEEEDRVEDADEEFDRVLEEKEKEEVAPVAPKEKKVKKGNMAPPPPPVPSQTEEGGQQKRSRDEILRQLKESRARAAAGAGAGAVPAAAPAPEPPASTLGSKFKKIGDPKNEKKRWIEQDETGRRREVLITTDAEGKTKRKVRWLDPPKPAEKTNGNNNGLLMPDKDAKPLGMEVPAEFASKAAAAAAAAQEEDEDDDIFAGVGTDYNPLADIAEDDASSSEEEGEAKADKAAAAVSEKNAEDRDLANIEKKEKEPAAPSQPPKPRNYFTTPTTAEAPELDRSNPLTTDPTILEALKRAAKLRQASPSAELAEEAAEDEDVDPETLLRRKKFLEEARRREALDNMDMDLGFGSSRIEDEEDDEYIEARGGQKRKRGPKKRKGDKENVADVMRVLERRKGEGEGKGKGKA